MTVADCTITKHFFQLGRRRRPAAQRRQHIGLVGHRPLGLLRASCESFNPSDGMVIVDGALPDTIEPVDETLLKTYVLQRTFCKTSPVVDTPKRAWPDLEEDAMKPAARVMLTLVLTPILWTADAAGGEQKLLPTTRSNEDFGFSVFISGDYAIVGAPEHGVGAAGDRGRALVFHRVGGVWSLQDELLADEISVETNAHFGWSVGISGDVAIVGAKTANHPVAGANAGAVYIFTRNGTEWTRHIKLYASDVGFADNFGWSVAIDGDYAVVGAPFWDGPSRDAEGAAYVLYRHQGGADVWGQQAGPLTAGEATGSDHFGHSVAISGNTAVVGAPDATEGFIRPGSACAFTRSGTVWTQQSELIATGGKDADLFGWAVAISGDRVIVGAPNRDCDVSLDCGAAYTFARHDEMWTEEDEITASDGLGSDQFGHSVALSGGIAVIGAIRDGIAALTSGTCYVFTGGGPSWLEVVEIDPSDADANEYFGFSTAASDTDVIVGAKWDLDGSTVSGAAYAYEWNDFGAIFADGFESGGTTAWSSTIP